jgi:S1-C subfamily serine protease
MTELDGRKLSGRRGRLRWTPSVVAGAAMAAVALACGGSAAAALSLVRARAPQPPLVLSSAQSVEQRFVEVVSQVGPSVVLVVTDQGLGSGVVFDAQGDIVTNKHVVDGGHGYQVSTADGTQYPAQLVGSFAADDLAVLRVEATGLQPAAFGDSTSLSVGDLTLALGNPLGLQSSVTEGIVSALGRTVDEGNGVALPDVIQTSAAINPGNSGGALVNLQGQVIGIPTLAAVDLQLGGGAAPGIGFAVPSNVVREVATQLINQGAVTHPDRTVAGVRVGTTTSGGGLIVALAQSGGPAARAGILAGDVITAVNGTATPDPAALAALLARIRPGQPVSVSLTHPDGTSQTVQVGLGTYHG